MRMFQLFVVIAFLCRNILEERVSEQDVFQQGNALYVMVQRKATTSNDCSHGNAFCEKAPTEEYLRRSRIENFIGMLNLTVGEVEQMLNISLPPVTETAISPTVTAEETCYCGGFARDVASEYRKVHGYVALVVCLFGTVANAINVVVLTRKQLSSAPINRILTWLAVADMLVMAEYVPFACYMYLILPERADYPRSWAVFILFHMHFTQVLHTISIFLTLALAVWRFIAIRYPQHTHTLCSQRRCSWAIISSFLLPLLVCSPSYMVFSVRETRVREKGGFISLYHLGLSDMAKENGEFLYVLNFWVYAVLIKLLPCLMLTIISFWLIKALYRANRRKAALRGYSACTVLNRVSENGQATSTTSTLSAAETYQRRKATRAERRTDRTTRMLLAILLLFLITEFPQGILGLLSGVLGYCFFRYCYSLFGEAMDILALLNGAINFILYCVMSRQFRTTFSALFKPRELMARIHGGPTSQTEVQSTHV